MERRGWMTTGRKGFVGVPGRSDSSTPEHNKGGLSLWFARAERYQREQGMPLRSVRDFCAEQEARNKVGLSPPLIPTPEGWLMIYHGVRHTAAGALHRLGLALFALDRPEVCLARGDSWIFGPEADCERRGDVANVAFPCGYTIGADGDTIHL